MDFSFNDEQQQIADLAKQIFADKASHERIRQIERSGGPRFDRELWQEVAKAGLLGIAVPQAHGGAGLGLPEERRAARCFGECARFGLIVRGDTDERGIAACSHESRAKFDAGDLAKMNVEHQTVEYGMFLVREELLS